MDISDFAGRSFLHLELRLRSADMGNHDANTALGDDVGDGVPNLYAYDRHAALNAEHWKQIDNRVSAPRDDRPPLSRANLVCNLIVPFLGRGSRETNQQLLDNHQEEGHPH